MSATIKSANDATTSPLAPAGTVAPAGIVAPAGTVAPAGIVAIADRVLEIARTDPERVAMIHAHHRPLIGPKYVSYTYAELSRRAESLAVGLRSIGVREGSLCSFMVPPCFDSLVLGVALWRVGAVTVGIEPHSHGLRRVARCLEKVGPEFFFGTPRAHAGRIAFGWGKATIHTNVVVGGIAAPGMHTMESLIGEPVDEPQRANVEPADITVIAFTTGSTGDPKPTVLRQRNFSALISMVSSHWGLTDGNDVVDMPTFPMFWIIGLSCGGTVVVPPMDFTMHGPGDADPARLMQTIADCGVRSMFASPALLENLADHAIATSQQIPSLRRIVSGGAEIQGPLFAKVKSVLDPAAEMYSDYGATEALPVAEISGTTVLGSTWSQTEKGAGVCVGLPLPGVQVKIIAIDEGNIATLDDATVLDVGEIGEIIARSPHISEDYFRSENATLENKIPEGSWHRIGDTGYLDEEGRLWICGRRSHLVHANNGTPSDDTPSGDGASSGETVYPLCVEPVFNAHPQVKRSALVGVSYGGSIVPTICIERVQSDKGKSGPALLEMDLLALADRFDATRLIKRVVFIERLPVDQRHNAKIDRPLLAQRLSEQWNNSGATQTISQRSIADGSSVIRMLK
ncbi:MAG: fatty acid CoA ligase family protein [Microthrixaceae bacterium]